jgi:hypothetical protein
MEKVKVFDNWVMDTSKSFTKSRLIAYPIVALVIGSFIMVPVSIVTFIAKAIKFIVGLFV